VSFVFAKCDLHEEYKAPFRITQSLVMLSGGSHNISSSDVPQVSVSIELALNYSYKIEINDNLFFKLIYGFFEIILFGFS